MKLLRRIRDWLRPRPVYPAKVARFLDEPELVDGKLVYFKQYYVVDGEVVQAPASGTVAELKEALGAKEVRRCDLVGRMMMKKEEP